MRPYSKVVQLVVLPNDPHGALLALCEDGSIWFFYPEGGEFELVTEMGEHATPGDIKYTKRAK